MRLLFSILFLCFSFISLGVDVDQSLFINRKSVMIGGKIVNRCVFNFSTTFQPINAVIDLNEGDVLNLTLTNNDTIPHEFGLLNGTVFGTIAPGESQFHTITYNEFGTYGLTLLNNRGRMLGAIAMVRVGMQSFIRFSWDFWEMNDSTSRKIGDGLLDTITGEYRPNVSLINGKVYPETTLDHSGAVQGSVNQEIYISMINAGNISHTLHFHGFHVEILQSVKRPHTIGWIKDGLPLKPDEVVTVKLVPDKPGTYPVHDHNLTSVLTGNSYPGGMITTIKILP